MGFGLIISAFLRAVSQLGDRRFRRVLWLGIALTFALLVVAYAGFLWLIETTVGNDTELPVLGRVEWLNDLLGLSSFLFMIALSFFLMIPVASAITSLFLDEVAQAVEDRHYRHLPPVPGVAFSAALKDTLNFLGVMIVANILAIGLYMIPVLTPFSLFIFWGVNGYLLGNEYFQLAAMRRIGPDRAKILRKKHRATIWIAGTLMAAPLTIPLVNLIIPILGAATFTHLYHALSARGPSD